MSCLKKFTFQNKWPLLVLLVFALVQAVMLIAQPQSHRNMKVISWDTFGYYLYLPSVFIYHDLFHLHFAEPMMRQYNLCAYFYAARTGPLGTYVMNYPLGLAIIYSPFFLMGHIAAKLFGFSADGFSAPYQYAIFAGGFFYSLLGLSITIRNLRFFFSEKLTAFLLVILLFGTNYFYYTTIENAMAHNYLFTVASFIIYFSIKWHANQRVLFAFILGLLLGLAAVIRPTEILWCIIPLLWAISDMPSVEKKLGLVRRHWPQLVLLMLGAFVVGTLQMIYWKAASGKFLYYSYDGGFDFLHPNILRGLFSLRKGWLVYTPVMALALMGIPLMWNHYRELFWVCALYTVVTIYVTFSWTSWWYGGSFGQRPMVETYALLIFPLGGFLRAVSRRTFTKWLLSVFVAFCIFLNCFQTWQFVQGFWSAEGPNNYMYEVMFLKTHRDRQMIRNFFGLEQRPVTVKDSTLIYRAAGNDSVNRNAGLIKISDSIGMEVLDTVVLTNAGSCLRIDGRAMFDPFQEFPKKFSRMVVAISAGDNGFQQETIMPLQPLIGNEKIWWERDMMGAPGRWDDVYMYVKVPAESKLRIQIRLQNPGQNTLYFEGLRVWIL